MSPDVWARLPAGVVSPECQSFLLVHPPRPSHPRLLRGSGASCFGVRWGLLLVLFLCVYLLCRLHQTSYMLCRQVVQSDGRAGRRRRRWHAGEGGEGGGDGGRGRGGGGRSGGVGGGERGGEGGEHRGVVVVIVIVVGRREEVGE